MPGIIMHMYEVLNNQICIFAVTFLLNVNSLLSYSTNINKHFLLFNLIHRVKFLLLAWSMTIIKCGHVNGAE